MALTEAGHNRRQPEQRKRAAVAAADADVQQPPAKEGRHGDDPSRRGVTAASLAQLSAQIASKSLLKSLLTAESW